MVKISLLMVAMFFEARFIVFAQELSPDFLAYELLLVDPGINETFENLIQQTRRQKQLKMAGRLEDFLQKYPSSRVAPEAKLQLAEIYRKVEMPIVSEWKRESENCSERSIRRLYKELCYI